MQTAIEVADHHQSQPALAPALQGIGHLGIDRPWLGLREAIKQLTGQANRKLLHAHGLEGGFNPLLPPGPFGLLQMSGGNSWERQRRGLAVGLREGAIEGFSFQVQAVVGCRCAVEGAHRLA